MNASAKLSPFVFKGGTFMLKEKLMEDLKNSMKEKNILRKNVVQMVRAAILQIEKDKGIEVDDNKILEIIAKEVKTRNDSSIESILKTIERMKRNIIFHDTKPYLSKPENITEIINLSIKSFGQLMSLDEVISIFKDRVYLKTNGLFGSDSDQ